MPDEERAKTRSRESMRLLVQQIVEGQRALPSAWGRRDVWQVRLRWWVPPAIVAGLGIGRWLGYEVEVAPILLVALCILAYNVAFAVVFARSPEKEGGSVADRWYSRLQVSLDYAAMIALVHYTGGAASPLVFFFVLHVIIAAILFRPSTAWQFAVIATVGMAVLASLELAGVWTHHPLSFRGAPLHRVERLTDALVILLFFAASVFVAAALATGIMSRLRERVRNLAEVSREVSTLNDRLNSLYAMLSVVGSEHSLGRILDTVTFELAAVMGVRGVAVKLLGEDGKTVRFAAAHGLPDFSPDKIVELARSPLNRRIIEGETIVFGRVSEDATFQLQDELLAAGIRSVVFAPLTLRDRVIGILGAYCDEPERFGPEDTGFFRLAAELVAIAIENARAYEAVRGLMQERSRFMLQVAHNMRAPLSATLSMLEVVREGYLGEMSTTQAEYLGRMDRKLRTLNTTVGELLSLARGSEGAAEIERKPVQLTALLGRLDRTFRDEATRKGLGFEVSAPTDLPEPIGDAHMLEQMLENLVSNAIKYTPAGGEVALSVGRAGPDRVRIEVRDTGIGIPEEERSRLFQEFFRGAKAREIEEVGTGLGLAIVRQIVDRHGGRIQVESKEGRGTTFAVELPLGEAGLGARPVAR
jgi:signal transduction histidine kinase